MGEKGALVEDLSPPSYDRPSWRNNAVTKINNNCKYIKGLQNYRREYMYACGYI